MTCAICRLEQHTGGSAGFPDRDPPIPQHEYRATGHTPGPWALSDDGWIRAPRTAIVRLHLIAGPGGVEEGQANARLIAAAPDLLAAADSALVRFGDFVDEEGFARHCIDCGGTADIHPDEPFVHGEGCAFGALFAAIAMARREGVAS